MSWRPHLVILVPREGLGREDEPVVPRTAPHETQVVDGHVALADDLIPELAAGLLGVLGGGRSAEIGK